jgi:uncharacterized protein (TIGR02145 family)
MEYGSYDISVQMDEYLGAEKKTLLLNSNTLKELDFTLKPIVLSDDSAIEYSEFKEVRIGNQIWAAQNLNAAQFSNGEAIPEANTEKEWKEAGEKKQPAWCYYDNKPENGEKYGKLYNWYAVSDDRKLCPAGWHIPDLSEWDRLISIQSEKLSSDNNAPATKPNISVFNMLPSGYRSHPYGTFSNIDYGAHWWVKDEVDKEKAWYIYFDDLKRDFKKYNYFTKDFGFSVRCIRN